MNPRTPLATLAASLTAVASALVIGVAVAAAPDPGPAGGHAQVVAQELVTFGAGEYRWEFVTVPIATSAPTPMTADPVTFMVAGGPSAAVAESDDGSGVRLAAGEAESVTPAESFQVRAEADDGSTLIGIAIAPGSDSDGAVTPGAGRRDVDLVRDVLATNEALVVEADLSAFVAVTAGTVDAAGTVMPAGTALPMTGRIVLINTAPETATVLVAVIGPAVGGDATDVAGESGAVDDASASSTAAPATQPVETTSTAPPSTTTTTVAPPTTMPDVDTDSDGLTDTVETQLGTDPNDVDSDTDGIPDGREVNALGSNPLDTDTDSDGLTDALEVDKSCGINAPDSDGDGLGDAFEANSGFSECSLADTDGDGDDDLAEFSLGTDPRDPNCFSGPGAVCA